MQDEVLPFEWFERDDYPRILEVMDDTHRLPLAFDEWEKHAMAGVQALEATRYHVVRTTIRSDLFADWCRDKGLKPNAQGRLKYCKEQLRNATASSEAESWTANPAKVGEVPAAEPQVASRSDAGAAARSTATFGRQLSRLLGTARSARDGVMRLVSRRFTERG